MGVKENTVNFLSADSVISQIVLALIICFLIWLVFWIIISSIVRVSSNESGKPWIIKTNWDAKRSMRLRQKGNNSTLLKRSSNEQGGIEFTYTIWLYVDDWNYNYNKWKHIFHKGNDDSWPGRAPGMWFHPNKNALRIYMNTFNNVAEYTDIFNIPMSKWFNVTMILKDSSINIYINGYLKRRMVLGGVPRQNWGDLHLCNNIGFSGFISRFRYYDYAIQFGELEHIINRGPSRDPCVGTNTQPPYLGPHWWQTRYI